MTLKAFELFSPGGDGDPDAVILAETPEEAASLLKAELREQSDENTWVVVFPISLFFSPIIGSKEERMAGGMWHYYIQAADDKRVMLLLNLGTGVELIMWIRELPVIRKI